MSEPEPTEPKGIAVIADAVSRLPMTPGVYRMIGEDGTVLYVGKAKKLKARVSNYTRLNQLPGRLQRMVAATRTMEFVTTRTETEALLLEANLIKRLRPRYNVLLRDDKSFPYIMIAEDHEAPQLQKHRGARGRKGSYFGPFASAGAVNRAINAMERAFLLRTCADSVYAARTRPCLLFQIKRCSGPCTGEIAPADYALLVEEAKSFLSGSSQTVRADLARQMETASERLDFEQAARLRDRISALSLIQSQQGINPQGVEEADLFALAEDGGQTCVQVFFFRTGQNWGNRSYFPRTDRSIEKGETLQSFIAQFYDDKPVPKLVLVSEDLPETELLAEALSERASRKVQVHCPQRGEKRDLVDHGLANARDALALKLAESASQERLLAGLAETLALEAPPRRIEIYDNSHIMGTNAIGAMVVSGTDGFVKSQYRTFTIRNEDTVPGDDFAMMREVLTRRFQRLKKENPDRRAPQEGLPAWPDLIIIDGGKGQLSATMTVLEDLAIHDQAVLAVSKGPDRDAGREVFHQPGKDALMLQPRDPVLFFVQRLRDEAHRFAIGTHRAKRSKAQTVSPLDEIEGIGPTRKRALLNHFGSAKAVARASLGDLQSVKGISAELARTIYNSLRGPDAGAH